MSELMIKIRTLQEMMIDVATDMDYYGGFDGEMQEHSRELLGAAAQVGQWIDFLGEHHE